MDDQRHVALPKLYGAPAYARPPVVPANPVPRPIDPDDLPLIAETSADDMTAPPGSEDGIDSTEAPGAVAEPAGPDVVGDEMGAATSTPTEIKPRPFSIRDLAERIRGSRP